MSGTVRAHGSLGDMFLGSASGSLVLRGPLLPLLPVPGQGHVQEVVLRVAIEGPTEAHGILHPSLVHLQVEPKPFAVVEHLHTHVGPHPQEHGGQPPDLKGIWAQNRKGDVGSSANMHPHTPPPACLSPPSTSIPSPE